MNENLRCRDKTFQYNNSKTTLFYSKSECTKLSRQLN